MIPESNQTHPLSRENITDARIAMMNPLAIMPVTFSYVDGGLRGSSGFGF